MALTRDAKDASDEWRSVIVTLGLQELFEAKFGTVYRPARLQFRPARQGESGNVLLMCELARTNARMVRTGITREVWEAVNESWMKVKELLARRLPKRGWATCSIASAASRRRCAGRWKAPCCATRSTISRGSAVSSNGRTTPRAFWT
jgi:uncharacterized alpha-E superfamily protein